MTEERKDRRGAPKGRTLLDGASVGGCGGRIGNPPHEPTDEQRRQVRELAGLQVTKAEIAEVMGLSIDTLDRHYGVEWKEGRLNMQHKLRRHSFDLAFGTPKNIDKPEEGFVPGMEPSPALTIWLTKTQLGWKETTRHELPGAVIGVTISPDDEEL